MKIKKKDFVEIEYTGRIADGDVIFDTTDENVAKENNIHEEHLKYGPVVICVGESQVLAGLDKNLEGKEEKSYEIKLSPEEGFGKKDAKLLKLIPASVFKKQNINLMPGLQVNIDGVVGIIRTVSGGRVIVDFNHPLASKELVYDVKINRFVTDNSERIKSLVKILLNQDVEVSINEGAASLTFKEEIPKDFQERLTETIVKLVDVKRVVYKKQ